MTDSERIVEALERLATTFEELLILMQDQQEANIRFAENVIKEARNDGDAASNL